MYFCFDAEGAEHQGSDHPPLSSGSVFRLSEIILSVKHESFIPKHLHALECRRHLFVFV